MENSTIFSAIASPATAISAQTAWQAVPVNSKLTFTTTHLGIADIAGLFKTFDVTVTASKTDFSDAIFQLSADGGSSNSEVEMRDGHLRSPDFFDAENYPNMTFKSRDIKKIGKERYEVTGDLALHGISKVVTVDVWYRGTVFDQVTQGDLAGFQLTGSINRLDFGIGLNFPSAMISDKVSIKADGEFRKK